MIRHLFIVLLSAFTVQSSFSQNTSPYTNTLAIGNLKSNMNYEQVVFTLGCPPANIIVMNDSIQVLEYYYTNQPPIDQLRYLEKDEKKKDKSEVVLNRMMVLLNEMGYHSILFFPEMNMYNGIEVNRTSIEGITIKNEKKIKPCRYLIQPARKGNKLTNYYFNENVLLIEPKIPYGWIGVKYVHFYKKDGFYTHFSWAPDYGTIGSFTAGYIHKFTPFFSAYIGFGENGEKGHTITNYYNNINYSYTSYERILETQVSPELGIYFNFKKVFVGGGIGGFDELIGSAGIGYRF
jgi:hypothetical protein